MDVDYSRSFLLIRNTSQQVGKPWIYKGSLRSIGSFPTRLSWRHSNRTMLTVPEPVSQLPQVRGLESRGSSCTEVPAGFLLPPSCRTGVQCPGAPMTFRQVRGPTCRVQVEGSPACSQLDYAPAAQAGQDRPLGPGVRGRPGQGSAAGGARNHPHGDGAVPCPGRLPPGAGGAPSGAAPGGGAGPPAWGGHRPRHRPARRAARPRSRPRPAPAAGPAAPGAAPVPAPRRAVPCLHRAVPRRAVPHRAVLCPAQPCPAQPSRAAPRPAPPAAAGSLAQPPELDRRDSARPWGGGEAVRGSELPPKFAGRNCSLYWQSLQALLRGIPHCLRWVAVGSGVSGK